MPLHGQGGCERLICTLGALGWMPAAIMFGSVQVGLSFAILVINAATVFIMCVAIARQALGRRSADPGCPSSARLEAPRLVHATLSAPPITQIP